MTKEEILQEIADCFDKEKNNKGRNSMGVGYMRNHYNYFGKYKKFAKTQKIAVGYN